MEAGNDREEEARLCFEMLNGSVQQVGFVFKDENKDVGCSPDGLTADGGLEIKCPLLKTHTKYLFENKLPTDYFVQVQGSMWVCNRHTWSFCSYYPGVEPLIITVERDNDFLEKLEQEVGNFNIKLEELYQKLKEK